MTNPTALPERWRADADLLARYGDDRVASVVRRLADELDAAIAAADDERLTLDEAAQESRYSKARLGHLLAEGKIPNAGRKGAPRIRRGDLPRRPPGKRAGFDPEAAAARILR